MATYNGMAEGGAWLDGLRARQVGVEVRLVIPAASSDGTRAHLGGACLRRPGPRFCPSATPPASGPFCTSSACPTSPSPAGRRVARGQAEFPAGLMAVAGLTSCRRLITSFQWLPRRGGGGASPHSQVAAPARLGLLRGRGCSTTSSVQHGPSCECWLDYIGVHDCCDVRAGPQSASWVIGESRHWSIVSTAATCRARTRIRGAMPMAKQQQPIATSSLLAARTAQEVEIRRAPRAFSAPSCELEGRGVASRLCFAMRWHGRSRRDRMEGLKLQVRASLGVW